MGHGREGVGREGDGFFGGEGGEASYQREG